MRGLTILLLLGVVACGQSGDLYLPEPEPVPERAPAVDEPPAVPEADTAKDAR